jgi:deoxyribodipyrimidine photo-lyase
VTLIWFRQDLRVRDNAALTAATKRGLVVPLYVQCDDEEREWPLGGAARWWLHHSLNALDGELRELGSRLIVMRGPALACLREIGATVRATACYWNRRYEPAAITRDQIVEEALRADGLEVHTFNSALLCEPWDIKTQSGGAYRVYTPFKKRLLAQPAWPAPLPRPRQCKAPRKWPDSIPIDGLELLPRIRWDQTMRQTWRPGEVNALEHLRAFLHGALSQYASQRDRPAVDGTSRLSPHLHFGEISPRQIWHAVAKAAAGRPARSTSEKPAAAFHSELIWREFAYHLLYHFPHTTRQPLDRRFERFPWKLDRVLLHAWRKGQTGYPLIDAGMRQLWATGWMHNRVRMIVGSFLVKNLQIHWLEGAQWFWDTLVDADLASNTLNWQWVAGCGADAAPYFRIFNPITQSRQFDANGDYLRRWVPELRALDAAHIHAPHLAPPAILTSAGISLGHHYPTPIVDLRASRASALAAYETVGPTSRTNHADRSCD